MKDRASVLIGNVLLNVGTHGWLLALALLTAPFILHRLGAEAYGLLTLATVITTYLGFLELGLGQALVKYLAEQAEPREISRLVWTALTTYLVQGFIGTALLAVLAPWLVGSLIRVPQALRAEAVTVLHLCAAGFTATLLLAAIRAIPIAFQRFDRANLLAVSLGSSQAGATILLLYFGHSLRDVVLANVVLQWAGVAAGWILVQRLLPPLTGPAWHLETLGKLFRFGSLVTVSSLTAPLLVHLDKVLIGRMLSLTELTFYAVAFSITTRLWFIPSSVTSVLFPAFSTLGAHQDAARLNELYRRGTRSVVGLMSPLVALLVVFGGDLLYWWLGAEFASRSHRALLLLSLAALVNTAGWVPGNLLQAHGRPDLLAKLHLGYLAFHLPVAYLLIQRLGIEGAALALLLREAAGTGLLFWLSGRRIGEPASALLRTLAGRGAPVILGSALAVAWVRSGQASRFSPWEILTGVAVLGSLYAAIVWTWTLDRMERTRLRHLLRGRGDVLCLPAR